MNIKFLSDKYMPINIIVILWALLGSAAHSIDAPKKDAPQQAYYSCFIINNEDEMIRYEECATSSSEVDLMIEQAILQLYHFRENGLAHILIWNKGWAYARPDGTAKLMLTYDNGPDYFESGLARIKVNRKIGYVDQNFDIKIAAIYDWAYPFENGYALACLGCKRISDGEHGRYEGGREICIDIKGEETALADCGIDINIDNQARP